MKNERGFRNPTFPQLFSQSGIPVQIYFHLIQEIFSQHIQTYVTSPAAKGVEIMLKQREQRHGKQWPQATALRACPNPLNASGGGFFPNK